MINKDESELIAVFKSYKFWETFLFFVFKSSFYAMEDNWVITLVLLGLEPTINGAFSEFSTSCVPSLIPLNT
jgi:hypothetical protein